MKAYNNVAPENGVIGHLLQAGQQPRHNGAAEGGQDLQREQIPRVSACAVVAPASIRCRTKCCSVQILFFFFQELLIIFRCLWRRGTTPPYRVVYLINNVYDPICGCDVTSHDVSTLEGEVLKEGEERGFAFASQ